MHATIVARSTSEIGGMGALIRDAVLSVEPEIPGVEPYSVADQMFATVAKERFAARIMGSFALAALLLAAVGIYGVLAYIVKQRTPEIGLRLAVGASGGRVVRLIVGRAMWMVGAGALLGVLSAFGLTRFLGALLFDVGTTDGLTYLSVTAVLVVVAFAASYIPARQASRVDPLKTLRSE